MRKFICIIALFYSCSAISGMQDTTAKEIYTYKEVIRLCAIGDYNYKEDCEYARSFLFGYINAALATYLYSSIIYKYNVCIPNDYTPNTNEIIDLIISAAKNNKTRKKYRRWEDTPAPIALILAMEEKFKC